MTRFLGPGGDFERFLRDVIGGLAAVEPFDNQPRRFPNTIDIESEEITEAPDFTALIAAERAELAAAQAETDRQAAIRHKGAKITRRTRRI